MLVPRSILRVQTAGTLPRSQAASPFVSATPKRSVPSVPQEMGPVSLISETGINLTEDLTANVRIKMPVAGPLRESWSVTSGIIWRWDTPADATEGKAKNTAEKADDCDCHSENHAHPHAHPHPNHEEDIQQPASEPACESCDKP